MFMFLLEVLTGKEGAGQSDPFFTLLEKKHRTHKHLTKAAAPPPLRPTQTPPCCQELSLGPSGFGSGFSNSHPLFPYSNHLDGFISTGTCHSFLG